MPLLTARDEAANLLALYGGEERLSGCFETLSRQFQVIQQRSQLLLTLATITLTITGFSGQKIAESSLFARSAMTVGLVIVLVAVVVLLGTLRIRWLTQFRESSALATLEAIISYRNRKTRWYLIELGLLAVGLGCFVAAMVSFFSGHR